MINVKSGMVTETLFFNGINGSTGRCGLHPMTVEALADHVLSDHAETIRRLRELQRELTRRAASEQKVLALVELLVTDIVRMLSAGPEPREAWFRAASRRILTILLGDPAQVSPGPVTTLARRLEADPVAVLVHIVRLLNAGQARALTDWLLEHDPASSQVLQASLASHFDRMLVTLQKTYFCDGGGEAVLTPPWIGGLTTELARLPVASLDPSWNASVMRAFHALAAGLLSPVGGTTTPVPAELQRQVAFTGSAATWSLTVAWLHDALLAASRVTPPLPSAAVRDALQSWLNALRRAVTGHLGTVPWVDPKELAQTGWGLVFPARMPEARCQAIQAALTPLLALRRSQAGDLYRVFEGKNGYRPGDTARTFLRRPPRGAQAANPADPRSTGVPYYLLLVGTPEEIPFDFQIELDVQYAVGRLDFGDDLEAYAAYARNIVAAEQPSFRHSSQVVFFGTEHPGDRATSLTARHLVGPLAERVEAMNGEDPWHVIRVAPEKATKTNLTRLLQLDPPPALLFTATHGLEFHCGHPRQRRHQGALLCEDWRGDAGGIAPTCYLSAQDITADMNLSGMILFFFACFSAGTPQVDAYHRSEFRETAATISDGPFVAALPKAMLALRDRGALAVVGHVERVWDLSFISEVPHRPEGTEDRQRGNIEVFAAAIDRLLDGYPVGSALDFFNMRYAAVATELTRLYEQIDDPPALEDRYRLAELWMANNDARGYVIVGDPATRIRRTSPGQV